MKVVGGFNASGEMPMCQSSSRCGAGVVQDRV